jgi:hypothetical protein
LSPGINHPSSRFVNSISAADGFHAYFSQIPFINGVVFFIALTYLHQPPFFAISIKSIKALNNAGGRRIE